MEALNISRTRKIKNLAPSLYNMKKHLHLKLQWLCYIYAVLATQSLQEITFSLYRDACLTKQSIECWINKKERNIENRRRGKSEVQHILAFRDKEDIQFNFSRLCWWRWENDSCVHLGTMFWFLKQVIQEDIKYFYFDYFSLYFILISQL